MDQERGANPPNAETPKPDDAIRPPKGSRPAPKREGHRRLNLVWFVRMTLSLFVLVLVVGFVLMAFGVIGTYFVHMFAPESWHWLTDQQMARLPLL